jgi:uncharacterized membrane protein YjfL (UPF0719 family)
MSLLDRCRWIAGVVGLSGFLLGGHCLRFHVADYPNLSTMRVVSWGVLAVILLLVPNERQQ